MPRRTDAARSSALNKKLDAFRKKCREAGLKITPQRTTVCQTLVETNGHPSADVAYRQVRKVIPNVSPDTVNRNLLTLSEIGVASVVEGSGDAKRFDANLEPHQHFRCVKCKSIFDVHHHSFDKIKVPSISRKFLVLRKTVHLEGICPSCRKKRR
ncbi:MAG: Fur family transcriptional regulator [Planctomycetota bacterium]|jgi:Fur family peroxide stress response transcriptional regulator